MTAFLDLRGELDARNAESCMREAGFEYTAPVGEMATSVIRFAHLPNVEVLRAQGFGVVLQLMRNIEAGEGVELDSLATLTASMSDAEARAFTDTLKTCFADVGGTTINVFLVDIKATQATWMESVARIEQESAMQQAWDGWRTCMSASGYSVESESDFFHRVDSEIYADLDAADLSASLETELRLAKVYADCVQVVKDVRDPLRIAARSQFADEEFERLLELQSRYDALLEDILPDGSGG